MIGHSLCGILIKQVSSLRLLYCIWNALTLHRHWLIHTIIRSAAVSKRLREYLSTNLWIVILRARTCSFGLIFFGRPYAGPSNNVNIKFGKACVAVAQSMERVKWYKGSVEEGITLLWCARRWLEVPTGKISLLVFLWRHWHNRFLFRSSNFYTCRPNTHH